MTRESNKEKNRFINIAYGSAAELKTQIWIGRKIGYIASDTGSRWHLEISEIASMLVGLTRSLK